MRNRIYLIITAVMSLAMLGLSACFEEPVRPYYYGSSGYPNQYSRPSWQSGNTYCDADGDRCVRCDADRDDCHPAAGYSRWHW